MLLSDKIVMMTNGPAATIGEVLRVELPRPRDRVSLAEDSRYQHYRKAVIDFLYTPARPRREGGLNVRGRSRGGSRSGPAQAPSWIAHAPIPFMKGLGTRPFSCNRAVHP